MRISPFPPHADRPVRGVLIYAWHGISIHLRSWLFLLVLGAMLLAPIVVLGASTAYVYTLIQQPDLVVASTDPELIDPLREAAKEQGIWVEFVDDPPTNGRPYLTVQGSDLREARSTLIVPDGAAKDGSIFARRLIHQARVDAWLTPEEIALVRSQRVDTGMAALMSMMVALVVPLLTGMFLFLGAMVGMVSGASLVKWRDDEYYAVLRLGTPAEVIFLGGLLERAGLATMWGGAMFAAMALPLVLATGLAAGLTGSGGGALALLPVMCGSGAVTGFLIASGLSAFATRATHGASKGAALGLGPIIAIITIFLAFGVAGMTVSSPSPMLFTPILGTLAASKGIADGLSLLWMSLALVVQVVWSLLSLRLGVWAFALDEGPFLAVSRWIRRVGGAS